MSKITKADCNYIVEKAQAIALFTRRATEVGCTALQDRADKEMALLSTFVSGIAVVKDASADG